MKKWQEPELSNLGIEKTQEDEVCPYENEASPMTTIPDLVWNGGKVQCRHWSCEKKGCINPNYGKRGICWPCPQAKKDAVGAS